jgi:hypothetical protein
LFHNQHQWLTLDEDAVDLVEEEEIVDVDVVEQDEEQSVTMRRNGEETTPSMAPGRLTFSAF